MEVSSIVKIKMEVSSIYANVAGMSNKKEFETIPLRMPVSLDGTIDGLAAKLNKSKQETMRLCMEIGAKWLESNGYDPTREIEARGLIDSLMELLNVASDRLISVLEGNKPAAAKKPRGGKR
jgi:hypothetical protein